MDVSTVCCTKCKEPIPAEHFNNPRPTRCSGCGRFLFVTVFPAILVVPERADTGERLLTDEQAGCFYHPDKKAVVPCENCGRFLCALCDVKMAGRDLCPSCIQDSGGQERDNVIDVDNRRFLYDSLALVLAFVPLLVTPLISLYLAIRHWSTGSSITRRTRARWVLAVMVALVQLGLWCIYFYDKYT